VTPINELLSTLTGNERAALKSCLGQSPDVYFIDLDPKQRQYLTRAFRQTTRQLLSPFERDFRAVYRQKIFRRLRIVGAAAIALLVVVAGGLKIEKRLRKPNIAAHCPVTVSSSFGDIDNAKGMRLVDGIRTNLAFHTNNESNPFVVIDLGKPRVFNTVAVYNRKDCCQERAVPLYIEVSDDGSKYVIIAERREPFDEWQATGLHAKGRYVRLRVGATTYFHLAEVEIY
jgi:N-acetylgalactosamine 4-sulfate 6-O-sulfotransferase